MQNIIGKRFSRVAKYTPDFFEGWYKKYWFVIYKIKSGRYQGWFDVQVRCPRGCLTCDSIEHVPTIEKAIFEGIKGSCL
jgi:hypothetical protein